MAASTVGRTLGRIVLQAAVVAAVAVAGALPAYAAHPAVHGGGHGGGGTVAPTGNDVSYPQCGGSLPSNAAFGIVGVNDGLASTLNPCFGPSSAYPSYTQSELYWAVASTIGGTPQPGASLYVNTADPGNVVNGTIIGDWPTSGNTPDGSCATTTVTLSGVTSTVGENSTACAWQYGYDMATRDAGWLTDAATAINAQQPGVPVPTTASAYPWWLDVETGNSWLADTTMNVADLQGMVAGFAAAGAVSVGVYSTSSQWGTITGGSTAGSLRGLPSWIPGARNLSGAERNCSDASFTGGTVTLTQWFANPDGDYHC